jgi:glycine C-acetyltransferase
MHNIEMLRKMLRGCGMETYGDPSAIVCVKMGTEALARLVSRRLPALGMLANLVEFPAVPKGQARFRLQVMANHSMHDIVDAVHRLSAAAGEGAADLAALEKGEITLADLAAMPGFKAAEPAPADLAKPAFGSDTNAIRRAVG